MFGIKEKQHIAAIIEKALIDLNHPEMPREKPMFSIHIEGKEAWSWADIKPNWTYEDKKPDGNPWTYNARAMMEEK